MTDNLFVYGTLCPGKPNAHILTDIGGEFVSASVKGSLHQEGWGATMGYPAIRLDDNAEPVAGFVFQSPQLSQHWQALDDFEGSAYRRVSTPVRLENGEQIQAWVYTLRE